ncbi:MAG: oxamate carbamoyltransferase subunit AllH family protein [Actinomycetes bacterium]
MPSTTHHAAASSALRGALTADERAGRVLGVFPSAVYVALGDDLLALETHDALRLPCAVVLPARTVDRPFTRVRPGDRVLAHAAELTVGPVTVEVVRWWRPRRPRTTETYDVARLSRLDASLPDLSPSVAGPLAALRRALATGADLATSAQGLLGLGAGLTPEGDDVLAGLLVTLQSRRPTRPLAHRLGEAVTALAGSRTTAVSAALLRHAADGYSTPRLVDVVDGLGAEVPDGALRDAVVRLLAVGHTSGAALGHGILSASHLHPATSARSEIA